MKKLINGRNYKFTIHWFNGNDDFCFYIEAKHKRSHRHSFINNVNCILSGLNINDINDNKVSESQWVVTKKEAIKLSHKAYNFLTDDDFREYVERYLDLDREIGEWNKL